MKSRLLLVLAGVACCLAGMTGCVSTAVQPGQTAGGQGNENPQLIKSIRVGYNPIGLAVTPDGKYVYAASSTSNSVSKIDTQTLNVVSTMQIGGNPVWVAISVDGAMVCVTAREG
ncbi:hypothetical protein JW933_11255, partial [candidate division FCPU426 bacterium]|nr:hypothetical protein [candidate division FCPU426 bacterium]